jgi:membrane protease YdiL (CAAX protease family)
MSRQPTQLTNSAIPSIWRLVLGVYAALIAAVAVGTLIASPFIASRVRSFNEMTYRIGEFPTDDVALQAWALTQPNVVSFQTERRDQELWIRSEYRAFHTQPPSLQLVTQMRALGYTFQGMHGGQSGVVSTISELITDPQNLATMLGSMQLAFAGIGLWRIHTSRNLGLTGLFPGHNLRAILAGLCGGLLLLSVGFVYRLVLTSLLAQSPPSPWDASIAMPMATKAVFLVFGGICAPVAEEIFFRGYVFEKFRGAGYVGIGLVVSSFLFAIIHFSDPYNVPCIGIYGAVLSWMFYKSGSLVAPIVAHAVNNGVAIILMVLA